MPRKPKTAAAPAAPPPAAPAAAPAAPPPAAPAPAESLPQLHERYRVKTRVRLPAKQRALEALKTIRLAVVGHELCTMAAAEMGTALEALPASWVPKRPDAGPLELGERVQFRPDTVALPRNRMLSGPFELVNLWKDGRKDGRSMRCAVKSDGGVVSTGILVSDLCRVGAGAEDPDPAPFSDEDVEAAGASEVDQ